MCIIFNFNISVNEDLRHKLRHTFLSDRRDAEKQTNKPAGVSWAMDPKGKKKKIAEENRGFNSSWTESFAFIANAEGLPACLLCNEKLSNNKKSNVERHFQGKHATFAAKYPVGSERKSAIALLLEKL